MGQKGSAVKEEKKNEQTSIKKADPKPPKDLKTSTDEYLHNLDTRQATYILSLKVRELRSFVIGLSYNYPEQKLLMKALSDRIDRLSKTLPYKELFYYDQYWAQKDEEKKRNGNRLVIGDYSKKDLSNIENQSVLTSNSQTENEAMEGLLRPLI